MRLRFWLCFLAAFAIAGLRNPDWWFHPQFVAEDGAIFFAQQFSLGPHAIALPYNNYLHVLPRLMAWIAAPFPVLWQPMMYQVFGVSAAAFAAAYFTLPECRFVIASDSMRMAVSLLALTDSHGMFLFANIAACQVFLVPVGVLLLAGERGGIWRAILAGLLALTAPALILFVPLALWRWVHGKRLLDLVFVACAVLQLGLVVMNKTQYPYNPFPVWLPADAALQSWIYRVFLTVFAGTDFALYLGHRSGIEGAALVVAAIIALLFWGRKLFSDRAFTFCLILGPVLILEALLARKELMDYFHDVHVFFLDGAARYFFFPVCLFFVAAAIAVEQLAKRWKPTQRAGFLLLVFLPGLYENYRVAPFEDLNWPREAARIEAERRHQTGPILVPINPKPWVMGVP